MKERDTSTRSSNLPEEIRIQTVSDVYARIIYSIRLKLNSCYTFNISDETKFKVNSRPIQLPESKN